MGKIATYSKASSILGGTNSTNKCPTKAQLIANYKNIDVTKLTRYTDNQLVDEADIIIKSKVLETLGARNLNGTYIRLVNSWAVSGTILVAPDETNELTILLNNNMEPGDMVLIKFAASNASPIWFSLSDVDDIPLAIAYAEKPAMYRQCRRRYFDSGVWKSDLSQDTDRDYLGRNKLYWGIFWRNNPGSSNNGDPNDIIFVTVDSAVYKTADEAITYLESGNYQTDNWPIISRGPDYIRFDQINVGIASMHRMPDLYPPFSWEEELKQYGMMVSEVSYAKGINMKITLN